MRTAVPTVEAVRSGDPAALARAITLVESSLEQDQLEGERLLLGLLPDTGRSLRIGITGAPGVGKSTLIDALGTRLCNQGRRVAVLTVDPSSVVSGGSVLGDKTRMGKLSRHRNAYIRPSPSGHLHGGVSARTREAILLCEAAGFDVVFVETVGTGQSEITVAEMVDFFLLLLSPAAGDELQGIKRGVMEMADAILVNKADSDLVASAERVRQQCSAAVHVLRGSDGPPVLLGSSLTEGRIDEAWKVIKACVDRFRADGRFEARRARQAEQSLRRAVQDILAGRFLEMPQVKVSMAALSHDIYSGQIVPTAAARDILRAAGIG